MIGVTVSRVRETLRSHDVVLCVACVAIVSCERLVQLANLANVGANLRVASKFARLCFEACFLATPID